MKETSLNQYRHITLKPFSQFRQILSNEKGQSMMEHIDHERIQIDVPDEDLKTLAQVFECIKEHQTQRLDCNCEDQQILVHIRDIRFPNLTFLWLVRVNIESWESLCRRRMPQLQSIFIFENKLASLKPLRKANFAKLSVIRIRGNEFRQINTISQADFPQLDYLSIGYSFSYSPEDLCCVLKLRSSSLMTLLVKKQNSINRPGLDRLFEQKYPGITVR